jgi:hypothetical protein
LKAFRRVIFALLINRRQIASENAARFVIPPLATTSQKLDELQAQARQARQNEITTELLIHYGCRGIESNRAGDRNVTGTKFLPRPDAAAFPRKREPWQVSAEASFLLTWIPAGGMTVRAAVPFTRTGTLADAHVSAVWA